MLQKKFRRLICLLLAIFTVLSLVACNNDNGNDPEQSTEASTTPPPPSVSFVPTQDCVIIRGDLYSSEENIADACFYLKMALKEVYGITAKIETDTVPATGDRCEFLVGVTNRTPSKKTYALLSLNDYSYNVSSKTSIVMCGGTPAKTYEAVMKFCEDVLTYNGKTAETKNVELKTRTKFEKFETYE